MSTACVLCRGRRIELRHLPPELKLGQRDLSAAGVSSVDGLPVLKANEVQLIRMALDKHGGNRAEAAEELGLHKTTLWRKMKRYGIEYP